MKNFILAALLLTTAISLSACKKEEKPQEMGTLTVDVIEIKKEPYFNHYEFSGFTSAEDTVEVRARVGGYILARKFAEGQKVKKGQNLFLIEPYNYEANLKSAQGSVVAAKATLEKTGLDLIRSEDLLLQGNTSQAMYDAAKSNFDNARAGLMQAQSALQVAELNMEYTNVKAPISGKISFSNYDVGNLVGPEMGTLTTIVDNDPINVDIGISEEFLIQFNDYLTSPEKRKEIKVSMELKDGSTFEEEGYIDSFDVLLNRSTNTVNTKIKFPNPDGVILPGQYALISLKEPVATDRAIVPQSAVTVTQGNYFAMVIEKNRTVAMKPITISQELGSNYIVESGLENGDLVIINNLQKIRPGMKVKYKKTSLNPDSSKKNSKKEGA